MWYVYILHSTLKNTFYKGLTNRLDARLNEHMNGECRSTKHLRPIQLVHVEICKTREEARKLEKYFKNGYGRELIKEIAGVVKWHTRWT